MQTALQSAVFSRLNGNQKRSLAALQKKVEQPRGYGAYTAVSAAQQKALQAAYNAAKASGQPIPPEAAAAAAELGLK